MNTGILIQKRQERLSLDSERKRSGRLRVRGSSFLGPGGHPLSSSSMEGMESPLCTLHTLFNGPFLRQTNWTKQNLKKENNYTIYTKHGP